MNKKTWTFTYPNAPTQHIDEDVMRKFVAAVNGSIVTSVEDNLMDYVKAQSAEHGELNQRTNFWFKLALEEALVNIPKHDMLDVHGTDMEILLAGNWEDRHHEFVEKILQAQGRSCTITVEVYERGFKFSYTLSRPFPNFNAKWENARLESPSQDDLEKACGRGLILMGQFFQDAHYDDQKLVLSFDHQWQEGDFEPISE